MDGTLYLSAFSQNIQCKQHACVVLCEYGHSLMQKKVAATTKKRVMFLHSAHGIVATTLSRKKLLVINARGANDCGHTLSFVGVKNGPSLATILQRFSLKLFECWIQTAVLVNE
jgi:hypothetical protein